MHAIAMLSLARLLPYIFAAAAAAAVLPGQEKTRGVRAFVQRDKHNVYRPSDLESWFGSSPCSTGALSCLSYNLLLYTYGTWRLRASLDGADHALHLKSVFTAPFVATLIALIIFVFDVPAPRLVREIVSSVSVATVPSSMIVVGATLGNARLLDALKEKSVYLISLVRLVLIPAIVLFVLRFLTDDPVLLANCVILAACPQRRSCGYPFPAIRYRRRLCLKGHPCDDCAEHDHPARLGIYFRIGAAPCIYRAAQARQ